MILLCKPLSKVTFGDPSYSGAIAILSVAVLFTAVCDGQRALIQGMRRIRELATLSIIGSAVGTIVGIILIYFLGKRGISPVLVSVAGCGLLASWWYARKIPLDNVLLPFGVLWVEVKKLLALGVVLMASGLMLTGVGYLIRVIIIQKLDWKLRGFIRQLGTYRGCTWVCSQCYEF